jgi:hypothetical protein
MLLYNVKHVCIFKDVEKSRTKESTPNVDSMKIYLGRNLARKDTCDCSLFGVRTYVHCGRLIDFTSAERLSGTVLDC